MKKVIFIYFLLHFLLLPVWAKEYNVKEYIPVDEVATVHTDKFDYKDFVFSSSVDEKGNYLLKFNSIYNNKRSRSAVSINLLIFDSNKKNIGNVLFLYAFIVKVKVMQYLIKYMM